VHHDDLYLQQLTSWQDGTLVGIPTQDLQQLPGVSWLGRPSAPLGTVGVNNLPTLVM